MQNNTIARENSHPQKYNSTKSLNLKSKLSLNYRLANYHEGFNPNSQLQKIDQFLSWDSN